MFPWEREIRKFFLTADMFGVFEDVLRWREKMNHATTSVGCAEM